jgi:5-carboxymethyl-2-hydroxymuconate isomerase
MLEYTANIKQEIDLADLLVQLHLVLVDVGGIPLGNCKSRAIRLDDFHIAGGEARHAFVHLTIRFLEGRSTELKQQIGRQSLGILEKSFAPSFTEFDLQITVEIKDIERATYFKIPEGTL